MAFEVFGVCAKQTTLDASSRRVSSLIDYKCKLIRAEDHRLSPGLSILILLITKIPVEKVHRIHLGAIQKHLVMKVVSLRLPCSAYVADNLAALNALPFVNDEFREVA